MEAGVLRDLLNERIMNPMKPEIFFTEQQHFRQPLLWMLLLALNAFIAVAIAQQLFMTEPFGDNPMSDAGLIITACLILGLNALFITMRLDTQIQADGVYYRFFPFQRKFRFISWDRINSAQVRTYHPIGDYGGWGMRIGLFGKGQAFNVSGNKGLQLEYDQKVRFLLGTQKPDEIQKVLQALGRSE